MSSAVQQHLGLQFRQVRAVQCISRILVKVSEPELVPGLAKEPSLQEGPDGEHLLKRHEAPFDCLNVLQIRVWLADPVQIVVPENHAGVRQQLQKE